MKGTLVLLCAELKREKAEAVSVGFGGEKGIEDAFLKFGRDACSVVMDFEGDVVVLWEELDEEQTLFLGSVGGVEQEIEQGACTQRRVHGKMGGGGKLGLEGAAFEFFVPFGEVDGVLNQLNEVDVFALSRDAATTCFHDALGDARDGLGGLLEFFELLVFGLRKMCGFL